jgi:hypothetical protein
MQNKVNVTIIAKVPTVLSYIRKVKAIAKGVFRLLVQKVQNYRVPNGGSQTGVRRETFQ